MLFAERVLYVPGGLVFPSTGAAAAALGVSETAVRFAAEHWACLEFCVYREPVPEPAPHVFGAWLPNAPVGRQLAAAGGVAM